MQTGPLTASEREWTGDNGHAFPAASWGPRGWAFQGQSELCQQGPVSTPPTPLQGRVLSAQRCCDQGSLKWEAMVGVSTAAREWSSGLTGGFQRKKGARRGRVEG